MGTCGLELLDCPPDCEALLRFWRRWLRPKWPLPNMLKLLIEPKALITIVYRLRKKLQAQESSAQDQSAPIVARLIQKRTMLAYGCAVQSLCSSGKAVNCDQACSVASNNTLSGI